MAGIIAGINAKCGIAPQAAWGTKAVPLSSRFAFTSESLKKILDKKEEDALVGAKTTGRMDKMGSKVEGDVNGLVKGNEIGWWLAYLLGVEAEVSEVVAGSAYLHTFTPVAAESATTLYPVTIVVDRITKTYAFEGCKLNAMKLDAKIQDYLRVTFTVRGRSMVESTGVVWPTKSGLEALKFLGGSCAIAGAGWTEVTGFSMNYNNNLEDNLYTMDGSAEMAEIEPQKRDITGTLEVLLDSTTEAARSSYFESDTPLSVVLQFSSDTVIASGEKYYLKITFHNAYITDDPHPGVAGPDRLKLTFNFKASEQNGTEAVTVELQDAKSTKYMIA